MNERKFSALSLAAVGVLTAVGSYWAFARGGKDFLVFYEAWRLVLSGWGQEIYRATSDRFLYAPGFAWLLAPLGFLPRPLALGLWCLAKALVLGFVMRKFAWHLSPRAPRQALGWTALGVLMVSRPLLIDFQYGQVNLFILGACVWAVLGHFERRQANDKNEDVQDFVRWFALAFAAGAKLFALPLLLIPFVVRKSIPARRLKYEILGLSVGFAVLFVAPFLTLGPSGGAQMYLAWRDALMAKGLPTETHNQSFAALLFHYLSGNSSHVIALGGPRFMGFGWLSQKAIVRIALGWTALTSLALVAWITQGTRRQTLPWAAITIGALVVPSHLIWKPYLVMALPLTILSVHQASEQTSRLKAQPWLPWLPPILVFITLNLTNVDLLGRELGARAEAASLFLIVLLVLIANAVYGMRNTAK